MRYKVTRLSPAPLGTSCRKAVYHSKEAAEEMVKHIKETRVAREIRAYQCTVCGGWHLTSRRR